MEYPHRRKNTLTGEWVLVSPHRTRRPWKGQVEKITPPALPEYDSACYLCPGNERAGGATNPDYESTFAFTNDYAALVPDVPPLDHIGNDFFQAQRVRGTSRVICFSPRHDLSLARMSEEDILLVVEMWAQQAQELGQDYRWVQIFENRGAVMGSSMPHPHGQIWASDQLPNEPFKEDVQQSRYYNEEGQILLLEYVAAELKEETRIVLQNDHWVVLVPFWAIWPFETMLLPRFPVQKLQHLSLVHNQALSQILSELLIKYDNLFETSFPYSMGWHPAPNDDGSFSYWQLHAHFYPPLLRSATVKKFLVGYEMLAEAQRDISPEQAAKRLRELPDIHYLDS